MPTPTDLVTDLPADFEVFGQAVDTSLADLRGGTTGQILTKTTNADMDFTWAASSPGDITGVTASSPLTGGGTSGDVTVGIQDASTTQKGAVQLENSTSSTSTTTAAVPASVKSAYDLANGAIAKSTVTTNGDLIYGTGSAAVTRLGIGSTGNILTVAGGVPSWAAPAGAGGTTFISRTSFSNVSDQSFDNVFDGSYCGFIIVIERIGATSGALRFRFKYGSSTETTAGYRASNFGAAYNTTALTFENTSDLSYLTLDSTIGLDNGGIEDSTTGILWVTHLYTGPNMRTMVQGQLLSKNDASVRQRLVSGVSPVPAGVNLNGFKLFSSAANVTGAVTILGVKNS